MLLEQQSFCSLDSIVSDIDVRTSGVVRLFYSLFFSNLVPFVYVGKVRLDHLRTFSSKALQCANK